VGVAAQGELQHNTVINCDCIPRPVGLKIEIHEIHQNLGNPMCIIN